MAMPTAVSPEVLADALPAVAHQESRNMSVPAFSHSVTTTAILPGTGQRFSRLGLGVSLAVFAAGAIGVIPSGLSPSHAADESPRPAFVFRDAGDEAGLATHLAGIRG